MANFDHLKTLEVGGKTTAKYPMHNITVNGMSPTLILSPATDANKPYFNTLLKRASKAVTAIRAGVMTAEMIEDNREEDRELYPEYIVKNWINMLDGETGKDVPFSAKEAKAFFKHLPNWLLDDLRVFCSNPSNFAEIMDIKTQAKN